jgi:hypothetical protein
VLDVDGREVHWQSGATAPEVEWVRKFARISSAGKAKVRPTQSDEIRPRTDAAFIESARAQAVRRPLRRVDSPLVWKIFD